MSKYKSSAIRQLKDHQVQHVPPEAKLRQVDRAEQLLGQLDPDKTYRYDELCRRLMAQRPTRDRHPDLLVNGKDALHDLRLLVEDLSDSADISPASVNEPVLTVQDVSRRFNVSTKTVDRWRTRGLVARRFRIGQRKRVGFLQSSVDRFVETHPDDVRRGGRFSQLSELERERIIQGARRLAQVGGNPAEVARRLAKKFGRSPEAIRYTLKNHDRQHPSVAIFPQKSSPLTPQSKGDIAKSVRRGVPVERLARKYGRTKATIERVVNEIRAQRILDQPIEFVHNESFEAPDAETEILGPAPDSETARRGVRAPAGLPPYLASLYEIPLLTREQEAYYFRRMNYLKFRASKLREKLDSARPKSQDLDRIEKLLDRATQVKNLLTRRNLRLVVSIAKKRVRAGSNLFEMISDGNVSLMRAIDRFDYGKGFKLSTYATWAISNNFSRSIPAELTHRDRFRTGNETLYQESPDRGTNPFEQEQNNRGQRNALRLILKRLHDRERDIIETRFGLKKGSQPQTLEQVGHRFGVTKERIRQLEKRALSKLRDIATTERIDIPGMD